MGVFLWKHERSRESHKEEIDGDWEDCDFDLFEHSLGAAAAFDGLECPNSVDVLLIVSILENGAN